MKTRNWALVIVLAVMFTVAGMGDSEAASYKYMTILTGGTGGVYYPLGGGIADVLTKKGISNVSAESTGGSVENCNLVGRGRAEMGFAMAGVCYDAYKGEGKFKERGELPIMAMMSVYPAPMHILVLDKSDIHQLSDLKGAKVSLGAFGSGTENMAKNILETQGITYDDIKTAFLSFSETAMGLRDGVVEAGFMAVAIPASAVLDLGSTRKVRFIPLTDGEIKKTLEAYPYYSEVTIKGSAYNGIGGITGDTAGVGVQNVLVCRRELPEDLVYNMVKTIFESQKKLLDVHQVASQITIENAVKVPIDLHPGAARYFREMGAL
ncbi:TAXI family TRAP transporter solute-binding subunit [Desulfosarcina ovata]|uniref:C4-dicarboxylate ABC transporter substrate-binding protein n=1 Tax=Desulfosarcina ovata subsp. ovata TaxID=2752305 RepID=A0A5K8A6T4_9BACT|nr:TAXI family TRAP transporter solute-binding subunit [Desulfosarcina ovata]BBO88227.1 C4-dicarboxylate ABC transporter substrate-binding protein [Desulfosarcina ovata subsp. ovata]